MTPNIESVFDGAKEIFVPLDLQIRMQSALHENSRATEVERFLYFVEDDLFRKDVALAMSEGSIKRTETAVLRTKIRVIDVAIDYVSGDTLGVQFSSDRVGLHSDADQVVTTEEIDRLLAVDHCYLLYCRNGRFL